jgi:hypothetical protein
MEMVTVLNALGLSNVRVNDVLLRSALAVDTYDKALKTANAEVENGAKTLEERYALTLQTTQGQLTLVSNRLTAMAIALSKDLNPIVLASAKLFAQFAELLQENSNYIGTLAIAFGSLGIAIGAIKLGQTIAALQSMQTTLFALQAVIGGAATAWEGLMLALGTTGAIAAAITAFGLFLGKVKEHISNAAAIEQANQDIAKSHDLARIAVMKGVEEYKKHGIVIQTQGRDIDQIENSLRILQPQLLKNIQAEKDAAKAASEHAEKIKLITQANVEREKRIAELMGRVTESTKKDDEWVEALQRLAAQGKPASAMLAEFGNKIHEVWERAQMLGNAEGLPLIIRGLAAIQEENAALKAQAMDGDYWLNYQLKLVVKNREEITALNKAMQEAEKQLSEHPEMLGHGVPPGMRENQLKLRELGPVEEHPMLSNDDMREKMLKAEQAMRKFVNDVNNDIDRALDRLLKGFVENGKIGWREITEFGVRMFDNVIAEMTRPLREAITKLITGLTVGEDGKGGIMQALTSSVNNLGDKIAGVFHGKAGGTLSTVIGGALSAGITAAIGIGIQAVVGLFKKSGSEVNNELVKNIQNPFADAVGKLMDSFHQMQAAGKLTLETAVDARVNLSNLLADFTKNTEAYAAMGGKNALAVTGAWKTITDVWGDNLSNLFGEIDASIEGLGGTAGMTAVDLQKLQDSLKVLEDFNNAVKGIVESVTDKADNAGVLEAALKQLQDAGVPTALIMEQLKDQIKDTAVQLIAMGLPIPPMIQQFLDLILAEEKAADQAGRLAEQLAKAQSDLDDVNKQLEQVGQQLADALIQKLDYLDNQLEQSRKNIEDWTAKIAELDIQIADAKDKLVDAEYWQKRYNDLIADAENQYESAVNRRMSLEQQIADLQNSIETDKLNDIIKNSKNAGLVKMAQAKLNQMAAQKEQDRIKQLQELQQELQKAKEQEAEAIMNLQNKTTAAQVTIEKEKEELKLFIESKEKERAELIANIAVEQARIATLEEERKTTIALMDSLGVARQSELEKMSASIDALMRRKEALEAESEALNAVIARIQQLQTLGPGPSPLGGPFTGSLFNGLGNFRGVPQFEKGIDYVPNRMLAYLDPGERVLTKQENRDYSTAPRQVVKTTNSTNLSLNLGGVTVVANDAKGGRDAGDAFIKHLQTNGKMRATLKRILKDS